MSVEISGQVPPQVSQAVSQAAKDDAPTQAAEIQAQTAARVESAQETVDKLERATDQLNDLMLNGQRSLSFSVDKNADQVVVQVVDKSTQELVRQIPTPEALKLAQHIEGMIGVIFNRQI